MLNGTDRSAAIYAAFAQSGAYDGLNDQERAQVRSQLARTYNADTTYIVGAAQIVPGTLNSPAGQPVATSTGAGATTAPQPIAGIGKLV